MKESRTHIVFLAVAMLAVFATQAQATDKQDPIIEHLSFGVRTENGARYVYIARRVDGQELVAVSFDPTTYEEHFETQRFFGFDVDELEAMEGQGNGEILSDPTTQLAAELWHRGFPTNHIFVSTAILDLLSRQSQLLAVLLDLLSEPSVGVTLGSDGCTGVPDFDFRDCCEAHDACYSGGPDCKDRRSCDRDMRDCIVDRGHPILGPIYYWGVRAFGWLFYLNCPVDAAQCAWDLNGDLSVDHADVMVLLGANAWIPGDLIELLSNWGPCPAAE